VAPFSRREHAEGDFFSCAELHEITAIMSRIVRISGIPFLFPTEEQLSVAQLEGFGLGCKGD
jgi:hypothetical protein